MYIWRDSMVLFCLNGLPSNICADSPWLANHAIPLAMFFAMAMHRSPDYSESRNAGCSATGLDAFIASALVGLASPDRLLHSVLGNLWRVPMYWRWSSRPIRRSAAATAGTAISRGVDDAPVRTAMYASVSFGLLQKNITEYGIQIGSAVEMISLLPSPRCEPHREREHRSRQ
jgi:hypothetical protein